MLENKVSKLSQESTTFFLTVYPESNGKRDRSFDAAAK
jgi:hypothetical protein